MRKFEWVGHKTCKTRIPGTDNVYMRKFEWVGHKTCKTRIPGTDNVLYEKVWVSRS